MVFKQNKKDYRIMQLSFPLRDYQLLADTLVETVQMLDENGRGSSR
ncbi:hypothetical protein [Domibacillus aminovorans]|nr:hypothetical protein [Domibacillus aminovorans]